MQHDFWIGDRVRNTDSGETGIFEGMTHSGKAKVRIGSTHKEMPLHALEVMEDVTDTNAGLFQAQLHREGTELKAFFDTTLDLHIDKLRPDLQNGPPARILAVQSGACRTFLNKALELGCDHVTIIHGRGKGVLRSEVIHLLKTMPGVRAFHTTHGGGALKVELKRDA